MEGYFIKPFLFTLINEKEERFHYDLKSFLFISEVFAQPHFIVP